MDFSFSLLRQYWLFNEYSINLTLQPTRSIQKQSSRGVLRKRCSVIMQQIYRRTSMPKCDCRNHTLTWVFSCKFTAYFQNTFSSEHLWTAASEYWNFAIWSDFATHVHIVAFFEQSNNFKSNSTILKFYSQHSNLY